MATRKSTKGRVCVACRHPKPETQYATTKSDTCLDCIAEAERVPVEVAEEAPFTPPDAEIDYTAPTAKEIASRTLARRRLIHFIKRFRPKYMAGWVHEDICRRLERFVKDIEAGKEPRLLLMMPVRTGKSEIASRHFAPWVLGQHPEWEIIAASGAQSLATSFSRYIRDLVRSDSYSVLFPEMKLDQSSQSVENWNTTKQGGYLAAGIGTMITGRGAHCFPAGTNVTTASGYVKIEHLKTGEKVLGYDHENNRPVYKNINAIKISRRSDIIEISTESGRRLVCTSDHPIYVSGRGYVEAQVLGVGNKLVISRMPPLWETEGGNGESVQSVFLRTEEGARVTGMQLMSQALRNTTMRVQEIAKTWTQRPLLLKSVFGGAPCCEEREAMREVWGAGFLERCCQERKVLLRGVSKGFFISKERRCLSTLRRWFYTNYNATCSLLKGVRGQSPFNTYAGCGELPSQRRGECEYVGCESKRVGVRTGQAEVRGVRGGEKTIGASHRREPVRQPGGEPDNPLWHVSRSSSQVEEDTVAVVKRVRCGNVEVYDLQVEGTSNFFAEEILVHNCLIIDDPVKDAEASDSQVIRDNTWEWYLSTALSRLAPGGGVLGVLTHWNEDDWAGRVQQLSAMEDGDKFEIVKYPAINDQGDEYILSDDSIEQLPPGSTVPEGATLTRKMNTALHPERYTLEMLLRRKATYAALGQQRWWSALYQQSPSVEDGVYFTKSMFRFYVTDPHPLERRTFQAWDFAITEKQKSDYTVGATGHIDANNNLHVADVVRFKSDDAFIIADAILDNWEKHGSCATLGFEDGQIWKAVSAVFLRRCEERNLFPPYELLVPLSDKGARAMPLKGLMQGGKVWFRDKAAWWDETRKELTQFMSGGKHDDIVDACFIAGTRVTMHDGSQVKIEDVREGDTVATPYGPNVVLDAQRTSGSAVVYEVEFSDGRVLVGTAEHPVSTNRGWIPLANLTPSDIIHVRESQDKGFTSCHEYTKKQPQTLTGLSSTGSSTGATRTLRGHILLGITPVLAEGASYIETFGSFTTDLSQMVLSFTTRMRTISTTLLKTLNVCRSGNTLRIGTQNKMLTTAPTNRRLTLQRFETKLLSGISLLKASLGTNSTPKPVGRVESLCTASVSNAGTYSAQCSETPSIVGNPARTKRGTPNTLTMVRRNVLGQRHAVYNLTVASAECYYANDVLVHNCAWLARLALKHTAPKAAAPKPLKSWKDRLGALMKGQSGGHMSA